jgi:hypothetical protein
MTQVTSSAATIDTTPQATVASLPGIHEYKKSSAIDSSQSKSVIATCPAGQVVTGAGFTFITSSREDRSNIALEGLAITSTTVKVTAVGIVFKGPTFDWGVTAVASCGSASFGDYEIVTAPSASDSSTVHHATAYCPLGKKVIGAGLFVTKGGGAVLVDEMIPGTDRVNVKAFEYNPWGYNQDWTLTAQAICVGGSVIQNGYKIVSSNLEPEKEQYFDHAGVSCGNQVMSVGFDLIGSIGLVRVDSSLPLSRPSAPTYSYASAVFGSNIGTSWTLVSYAVCADW